MPAMSEMATGLVCSSRRSPRIRSPFGDLTFVALCSLVLSADEIVATGAPPALIEQVGDCCAWILESVPCFLQDVGTTAVRWFSHPSNNIHRWTSFVSSSTH